MIRFVNQGISLKLNNKRLYKKLIISLVSEETKSNSQVGEIVFVLNSTKQQIEVNNKFLKHNYNTDVITFNYNQEDIISGDVFLGVDIIKENAIKYTTTFEDEISRVIIHSILHLLGYNDSSYDEKIVMKQKEDYYLHKFKVLLIEK